MACEKQKYILAKKEEAAKYIFVFVLGLAGVLLLIHWGQMAKSGLNASECESCGLCFSSLLFLEETALVCVSIYIYIFTFSTELIQFYLKTYFDALDILPKSF